VISVALKTPLQIRSGICIHKTSLLHRPVDYIGFTPSCHLPFYNKIAPVVLGTTLNETYYVKFEMAKSRCRANASFLNLREGIENFMKKNGKPVLGFQSSEWMQDLAFMVDITKHLNNLKMSQGRKRLVTQYCDTIRAFKLKLSLWKHQLSGDDTALSLSKKCACHGTEQ